MSREEEVIKEMFKEMEAEMKLTLTTSSVYFMNDLANNPGLDVIRKEMQDVLLKEQTRIIRYE